MFCSKKISSPRIAAQKFNTFTAVELTTTKQFLFYLAPSHIDIFGCADGTPQNVNTLRYKKQTETLKTKHS